LKIVESEQFQKELRHIALYIKQDKPSAAVTFLKKLQEEILLMTQSPYMYRQSVYFDIPDIRDMVYRGYTIVYEIDKANAQIILLSIFNKNLPDL